VKDIGQQFAVTLAQPDGVQIFSDCTSKLR